MLPFILVGVSIIIAIVNILMAKKTYLCKKNPSSIIAISCGILQSPHHLGFIYLVFIQTNPILQVYLIWLILGTVLFSDFNIQYSLYSKY